MTIEELDNNVIIMHKQISTNVKYIRETRGISQLQLALDIGLTGNAFIARAEKRTNNCHFNIEHLVKIADVLDVDVCEFFIHTSPR